MFIFISMRNRIEETETAKNERLQKWQTFLETGEEKNTSTATVNLENTSSETTLSIPSSSPPVSKEIESIEKESAEEEELESEDTQVNLETDTN